MQKIKIKVVFSTGKSITNKTSKTNIGELMLQYGGGGHENAGACQIYKEESEKVLKELIEKIKSRWLIDFLKRRLKIFFNSSIKFQKGVNLSLPLFALPTLVLGKSYLL